MGFLEKLLSIIFAVNRELPLMVLLLGELVDQLPSNEDKNSIKDKNPLISFKFFRDRLSSNVKRRDLSDNSDDLYSLAT